MGIDACGSTRRGVDISSGSNGGGDYESSSREILMMPLLVEVEKICRSSYCTKDILLYLTYCIMTLVYKYILKFSC